MATKGRITFAIDDSKAVAKLQLTQKALDNPRPVYETIGRVLRNRVLLCFRLGVDPWGHPWKPIKWRAPRTNKKTGKLTKAGVAQFSGNVTGNPGQPLRDTGRLQRSFTSRADDAGVVVGTNVLYAPPHQFGAEIVPRKAKRLVFPGPDGRLLFAKKAVIPARPFLPIRRGSNTVALPPAWALLVIRSIKRYLQTAGTKAGA